MLTTLIEIQQSWVQEENLPKMYFAKSMIIVSKFNSRQRASSNVKDIQIPRRVLQI